MQKPRWDGVAASQTKNTAKHRGVGLTLLTNLGNAMNFDRWRLSTTVIENKLDSALGLVMLNSRCIGIGKVPMCSEKPHSQRSKRGHHRRLPHFALAVYNLAICTSSKAVLCYSLLSKLVFWITRQEWAGVTLAQEVGFAERLWCFHILISWQRFERKGFPTKPTIIVVTKIQ